MERCEVDVVEIRLSRLESVLRKSITQHVDDRAPGSEPRGEHRHRFLVSRDLTPADYLAPDSARKLRNEGAGFSMEQHLALRQDGHAAAQLAHVLDDMRREDHHRSLAD